MKTALLHPSKPDVQGFKSNFSTLLALIVICCSTFAALKFFAGLLSTVHENHYISSKTLPTEEALGYGPEDVAAMYPDIFTLCEGRRSVIIPTTRNSRGILLQFLEPLGAGQSGAVLKSRANEELIAFKIFPVKDGENLESQRREVFLLSYLSEEMEQVLMPKMGTKLHAFEVDGIKYNGFGMELFQHPTILEYLTAPFTQDDDIPKGCMKFSCQLTRFFRQKKASSDRPAVEDSQLQMRAAMLTSQPVKDLYNKAYKAIIKMWMLGVVHEDLHVGNIMYDENTQILKIADFGYAQKPNENQLVKFMLGVLQDFVRFTMTFVIALLFPRELVNDSIMDLTTDQWEFAYQKLPVMNLDIMYPLSGKLPRSTTFNNVFIRFRKQHQISDENYNEPAPHMIQAACSKLRLNWKSPDPQPNFNVPRQFEKLGRRDRAIKPRLNFLPLVDEQPNETIPVRKGKEREMIPQQRQPLLPLIPSSNGASSSNHPF